jgi:hypothetical protein
MHQGIYKQVEEDTTTPKEAAEEEPEQENVLGKRKRTATVKKGADKKRWKKMSILWELPYWKDLTVHHSIDLMHVKKNVCGCLLGILMSDRWKHKGL